MKSIKQSILQFSREESGQDLIEYALVSALLGLGAVSSMRFLAVFITNAFVSIGETLNGTL